MSELDDALSLVRAAQPGAAQDQRPARACADDDQQQAARASGDDRPPSPARSRGAIALVEENCTVCMLCARECPDWCLYIEGHTESAPPARPGGRPRVRNVLDRFAIDWSLCMYCGICVEVCPFDALFWAPDLVPSEPQRDGLVEERDALRAWVEAVPPPPPLDPAAEPSQELQAAQRLDAVAEARARR